MIATIDAGDVVATMALAVSLVALATSVAARRNVAFSDQLAGVPELLHRTYLNREFSHDGSALTFQEAREIVRMGDPAYHETVLVFGTLENRLAYEMSVAIERVGIMVLAGAIPLPLVLALCAGKIVEDWASCEPLVKKIRSTETGALSELSQPWRRRHGEWLACVASMYLDATAPNHEWHQKAEQALGDRTEVRRKEQVLRLAEKELMPPATRRRLRRLIWTWR